MTSEIFWPTYPTLFCEMTQQLGCEYWDISTDYLTFTIIYACIIMTHRTTGSLSEYQLLRTSHKLRNYCIHRSTTVERLQVQVYINIVAVTAGLHADNLHVGIFSMQE